MGLLIIRHKVKDYSKWRPQFDRHVKAQRSAGLGLRFGCEMADHLGVRRHVGNPVTDN